MRSGVRMVATVAALILATPVLFGAEVEKVSGGVKSDAGVSVAASIKDDSGGSSGTDSGQSPMTSAQSSRGQAATTPKVDLFLGYSYLRGTPTLSPGNRLVWLNGGSASIAFNLNRFLGIVGDFSGFADSELNLTGPGANPARVADSGGNAYTYLFGPRFSYRKHERFVPFAQALFGGVHASPVTLSGCTGASCIPLPAQNAFALTAGAGLDVRIQRHFSLRLVQAEYLMTRFADPTTEVKSMQNDVRLSAGLVYSMGGNPVSGPMAYTCTATPASVYSGDPVSVAGSAVNLHSKHTPTYGWRVDGGKISGTAEVANIDTAGVAPGNYTAQGHVSLGAKRGQSADCSAPFTVMALQPPTVSCSSDPSTAHPGESITIRAQATSPQNRPLTYSYSVSDGSISGNTATTTLTMTTVTPQPVTVTCMVADDKGQTASSTTTVTVVAPPLLTAPQTQKLCSINFDRDTKRPTRVDNEGKACLDAIALSLQHSSDATIALLGKGQSKEAAQRAVNTKQYLVTDKGIDPSRIVVYTAPSESKVVDTIMVPSGATLNTEGLSPVGKSVTPVSRSDARRGNRSN